jgi:pimeloyl-ACP methyl ester carboxylesterase
MEGLVDYKQKIGGFTNEEGKTQYMAAYDEAMKYLPKCTKQYDIDTSFGIARVYQFGESLTNPIVLLPGRSSCTPMWKDNLVGLAKQKTVLTIDLLGDSGKSIQTKTLKNSEDQAICLNETLTKINVRKVHLVAVSMGGWNTVNLFLNFPNNIASISLFDPANVFAKYSWKAIVFSLSALPFFPEFLRKKFLSWIAGGATISENDPIAKLIATGIKYYKAQLPFPAYPSDELIKKITIPILVVMAGRSIVHNSHKAVERAKRLLPNAQVECWEDASHAINGEFPEKMNFRILSFIDEVEK